MSLHDYQSKLRKANLIESKSWQLALDAINFCISILEEHSDIKNLRPRDLTILLKRKEFLTRIIQKYPDLQRNSQRSYISRSAIDSSSSSGSSSFFANSSSENTQIVSEEFQDISLSSSQISSQVSPQVSSQTFLQISGNPYITYEEIDEIINIVYSLLLKNENVEYNQYLDFYKKVNEIVPSNPSPVISAETDIVYYVGDTHGSYQETLIMIRYFIDVIKLKPNVKIIFLGDYVDRNPQDLENLTVLVAFSLKYPNNVLLLRGNHEDEKINRAYGFYANLMEAFMIEQMVETLYSEILKYFLKLPVINSLTLKGDQEIRIFAVHGGIPVHLDDPDSVVSIKELLNTINLNVKNYEEFDPFLNWLLWADPKEEVEDIVWDPIYGRSQFGSKVFWDFMKTNNFQFMVRAHEKWPDGYKFFFNNALVSLFSTSYYNNRKIGEAAFIRLEVGKAPAILRPNSIFLSKDLDSIKESD